ncbi:ArsR/SmtB family transcription factor [Fonticella tunisiensis]|uniref:ArsR family transcriptional regulator n=1 Tax=Fonticella tunisiensis TaxID=1096341 RepID=A0A4R7KA42_9CLOT|nr:metalloregulator ArsR/SmtB family transcription factor [Fonticella tunisiensis]TDT50481.1 ArsR family transcriptional regulator [Fonticella tunisiensis]
MSDYNLNDLEDISEILKAMAHPIRLCILKGLYVEGDKNVTTMQECLKIPQSTVSQHLSILRNKGIIKGKRNGLEITYTITDELVKKLIEVIVKNKL